MKRAVLVVAAATALAATGSRPAQAAFCATDVCVRFVPESQSVPFITSATFTVDIMADITTPVLGWGGDIVLSVPGIVSTAAAPSIGPSWSAAGAGDGDGLAGIAFPSGVVGKDILLATLTFNPASIGTTEIAFAVTQGDLAEGFPLDPTGFAAVSFAPGSITVIPEPSSLLLLAAAGFAARLRRGRRLA